MKIANVIEYLKFIKQLSILKSIRFNYHYFGIRGCFNMYVMISTKTILRELGGSINLPMNPYRGCVKIGFGVNEILDYKYERTCFLNRGVITFNGGGIYLAQGTRLFNFGNLTFGRNFTITGNSKIICSTKITIGDDCLASWDVTIMDTDFHKIFNENGERINDEAPIVIGNNCWLCTNVTILKHSTIRNGVVVGAGSIITKDTIKENCVLKNNKVIRENIHWFK